MTTTEITFLIQFSVVFYTYIGYAAILYLAVKLKMLLVAKKTHTKGELPNITMVVAAWNEEDCIETKIKNCLKLNYPPNKLNYIFITDGSTDKTNEIISKYPEIKLMYNPNRKGKTAAINRAMKEVKTEITVFSDANALLNTDALFNMSVHFFDKKVGCIAGEKRMIVPDKAQASSAGEGLYWKYESKLKEWDSQLFSTAGAAGELFAIRTHLFEPCSEDTILDDFLISLSTVVKGYKIKYEANAYAMEHASANVTEEIKRKIRICAGGFQAITKLPALLSPLHFPLFSWQYISHRVMRWTIAPLSLLLLLPFNVILTFQGPKIYTWLLAAHILFYAAAFLGWQFEKRRLRNKLLYIPFYFMMMNISVFVGLKRFLLNTQSAVWQKAVRISN